MRKIAISLSKGGVGKSTTAVHLAHDLAMAGSAVLLVDTDTQGQCSAFLGVKPTAGLAELVNGEIKPEKALVEARERLWLLPGGRGLAGLKMQIAKAGAWRREDAPGRSGATGKRI
jgi:chromosome partitioning protein